MRSAALLIVTLGIGVLRASDEPVDRESLRSLDDVRVAVENVPQGAPKGLDQDSLLRFVESRLDAAHVPLQRHGEYSVGDPFLRITLTITPEGRAGISYRVAVEFLQIVFLRRNPMLTFNRAQTWSANEHTGLVAPGQLAERARKDLAEEVDQFIAAYRSVNTK